MNHLIQSLALRADCGIVVPPYFQSDQQVEHAYREWTTADKQFSTVAKFIRTVGESVVLKKQSNGVEITVALKQLGKVDRDYVASLEKGGGEKTETAWHVGKSNDEITAEFQNRIKAAKSIDERIKLMDEMAKVIQVKFESDAAAEHAGGGDGLNVPKNGQLQTNGNANEPKQKLLAAAENSAREFKTSRNWSSTVEFDLPSGSKIIFESERRGDDRKTEITMQTAQVPNVMYTIIEHGDFWYCSTPEGSFKHRPNEFLHPVPMFNVMYASCEPEFVTQWRLDELKFVKTTDNEIEYIDRLSTQPVSIRKTDGVVARQQHATVKKFVRKVSWSGNDSEAPKPFGLQLTEYKDRTCLLYTSPSPRDATLSRMPSSA